ncbi:MAG: hypothetical protein HUU43_08100 [Ignavibacteriaceae bacterium]|nr:hypothetical protein [Ignavibacteriaceae bacterium]
MDKFGNSLTILFYVFGAAVIVLVAAAVIWSFKSKRRNESMKTEKESEGAGVILSIGDQPHLHDDAERLKIVESKEGRKTWR